jgi:hypothetical protein
MSYPDAEGVLDHVARNYKDAAASELYKEAGGSDLTRAHAKIARALDKQGEKLEEFFNTPYTKQNADLLEATTRALVVIEDQLERWHHLIYPNQRPT